jgi:hypothetical protein
MAIASRTSTRTVQIAHNVLVRAIRQAERDDMPAGMSPHWSNLTGLRTEEVRALRWDHVAA